MSRGRTDGGAPPAAHNAIRVCVKLKAFRTSTLLAHGARQELQDSRGRTALHQAAQSGYAGIVRMLCAAPGAAAALALQDSKGRTPLACALNQIDFYSAAGRATCATVLRLHGAL